MRRSAHELPHREVYELIKDITEDERPVLLSGRPYGAFGLSLRLCNGVIVSGRKYLNRGGFPGRKPA